MQYWMVRSGANGRMSWASVGYALVCIAVPLAWGVLVVWASNWIEAKVSRRDGSKHGRKRRDVPPIEYHI
jgi:hypothetical protein